jgi:hypothetical protein
MEFIERSEFEVLAGDAKMLARRRGRPKVFETSDGSIWKVIDARPRWSLLGRNHKAVRFASNARDLARCGIPCPEVLRTLWVDEPKEHVIVYRPVDGITLKEAMETGQRASLQSSLATFIARLHEQGVYFKGGHLENYILMDDGHLGIIDIEDVWIAPLLFNYAVRARSFRILFKYQDNRELLGEAGCLEPFIESYLAASGMSGFTRGLFLKALSKYLPEDRLAS